MTKVADIASYFDTTIFTLRRNAKLLLGKDTRAGRQDGKARKLSDKDAFILWLGTSLISAGGFKVDEAKTILKQIIPWLKREGFYIRKSRQYSPRIKWAADDQQELRGAIVRIEKVKVDGKPNLRISYTGTINWVTCDEGFITEFKPGSRIQTTSAQTICRCYAELKFPEIVNIFKLIVS